MRSCWTRQRQRLGGWAGSMARLHLNLHALAAYQLQAGSALCPPTPVAPEQLRRGDGQRVEEQADPAWVFGRLSMPLTMLAQPTRTAIADAGLIYDAQAAIGLAALFCHREQRSSGTAQRAIGLAEKVASRKAALFPGLAERC